MVRFSPTKYWFSQSVAKKFVHFYFLLGSIAESRVSTIHFSSSEHFVKLIQFLDFTVLYNKNRLFFYIFFKSGFY